MKKIYHFTLAIILCSCLCGCLGCNPKSDAKNFDNEEVADDPQDDAAMAKGTHLKFKGVPIDGDLETFVTRMKRAGFKHAGTTRDGAEVLEGDFAGHKDCTVYVSTLDNQDLVSNIMVVFQAQDRWEYLYGDYKGLKQMLTEKYGKPSSCIEKFQDSFGVSDDRGKMYAVQFDKCKYETRFTPDNGEIVVWIEHEGFSSCYVALSYFDDANSNTMRQNAKDDL